MFLGIECISYVSVFAADSLVHSDPRGPGWMKCDAKAPT